MKKKTSEKPKVEKKIEVETLENEEFDPSLPESKQRHLR
jgi:hypothetical protein